MPPETLPSQAASSGFPRLFMEALAEVTGTSPVRLTFGSYSCLVHYTRPLKLSRHCSLLFARTCSFLFSFYPITSLSLASPQYPWLNYGSRKYVLNRTEL